MAKIITKWIEDANVTIDKLNTDVAGDGISGGAGTPLTVVPNTSGGLYTSNGVGILLNSAALSTSVSGLRVEVDDSTIEVVPSIGLRVKHNGITDWELAEIYIKANGTVPMSGNLNLNSYKVINLADATNPNDAVNLKQLNAIGSHTSYRYPVHVISLSAAAPATGNNILVDGTIVEAGDFVLYATYDGKVYTAEGTTTNITGWSVRSIADVSPTSISPSAEGRTNDGTAVDGDTIWVMEGSTHADKRTSYNGAEWVFTGGNAYIYPGDGLRRDGDILHVNLGAGITNLPNDEIGIDLVTDGGLQLTSLLGAGQLMLDLDETNPGLEIVPGQGLNIKLSANSLLELTSGGLQVDTDTLLIEKRTWEEFILSTANISGAYVDLANVPVNPDAVGVAVIGGPTQENNVDFNVITNGSAIKRISWLGLGLASDLAVGDILQVYYTYHNTTNS